MVIDMYPAHILESGEIQTVREHCRSTAELAARALRPIGLTQSAYLAGLLHDLGKCKEEFRQYLEAAARGDEAIRGSVNHTFAAVRYILEHWHRSGGEFDDSDVTAELLAFAAGAHHGLFDCIGVHQDSGFFHRQTKEGIGYEESVQNYLKECIDAATLDSLFQQSVREISAVIERITQLTAQESDEEANREITFHIGLLARLLLSAVIEGDRRDTAEFMDGVKFPPQPEDMRPIWTEQLAFLEQKLSDFSQDKPINQARQTIPDFKRRNNDGFPSISGAHRL